MADQDLIKKIAQLRLLIGDIPSSPFYQLLSDDELEMFLDMEGGSLRKAFRRAAITAGLILSGYNTREVVGDEQIWNTVATAYQKVLEMALDESSVANLGGLTGYAAGISWEDICKYRSNPDFVRNVFTDIAMCDFEDPCRIPNGVLIPIFCGCG